MCEQQLDVVGSMPQHLQGVYLRVGPNPYLKPVGGYHWCAFSRLCSLPACTAQARFCGLFTQSRLMHQAPALIYLQERFMQDGKTASTKSILLHYLTHVP